MLNTLKRFFNKITTDDSSGPDQIAEHDIRVATCALFLEMARIDELFTQEETATILSILRDKYGLSQEHSDALMTAAAEELKNSIDYWQFARLINENYSTEEKIEIIETLWRIVYVDGKLDKYEDHLIHKLSTLLRLSHDQLIHAKLKVLRST